MLKSFCIKNNNELIIQNLITEIEKSNLENIYITQSNFALYENLIIHYSGNDITKFIHILSEALTKTIIKFYEPSLLQKILNENYFYFFEFEKNEILNLSLENSKELDFIEKTESIYKACYSYIIENKSMILDGFVRFRLYNYIHLLDEIVNYSVNNYLIQREYIEFIHLLKEYISNTLSCCKLIHLIYSNGNVTLLDENNAIVSIDSNISNTKFISDISFSKNDYCLNTLLSLLPEQLVLHILSPQDEFIETVKLIFSDRLIICNSCELCLNHSSI